MGSPVTDCGNCSPPKVISGHFSGFVCGQERASSIMAAGKLYVSRRLFLSPTDMRENHLMRAMVKKIPPSSFLHLAFGKRTKDLKVRVFLASADHKLTSSS